MNPFRKLREAGVLGINARNARFITPLNPRRLFPLVDDKLRTKALAHEAGVPTPELYGVIEANGELRHLEGMLEPYGEFVIKPARGAMGNGVLVVTGREGPSYVRASGARMNGRQVVHYVSGILSGLYSIGGHRDRAMIESRVPLHPVFAPISQGGVPDVRVVVCKGVPAMAMLRLPTRRSDGRANLHQGAIAAGIDLARGRTHHAVQGSHLVSSHPDTGNTVVGVELPHWEAILHLAAVCADRTGLGYLGVDVVLDPLRGPLLLELNARPGLSIQIACFRGLWGPLGRILERDTSAMSIEERVSFGREAPVPVPLAKPEAA